MHNSNHHIDHSPGSENYEQRDAHLKLILISGVVLVVIALGCFLTGYIIMNGFESRPAATEFVPSPIANERVLWQTEVRLQSDPGAALKALEADFAARVTKYEVLGDEPLVYRIPVNVAMDIIAKNGLVEVRPVPPLEGAAAPVATTPTTATTTPAPAEAAH